MEILSKIAAVIVTLLLYGIITILQMPSTARAASEFAGQLEQPRGATAKIT